ncbi:SO2930 family diheme c-type cytochrome [Sphingopyxis sp. JAI128]|uniref:SO2930 family diheme c-type cytochrome n=1 Tax=Sphingopyxis sp. JAI128 TaxID=2723066 RepID=UPI00161B865D|nr:SO2930 family diheme c-type cytochrome [Sphingopyxis sp. JAI128]MBB6424679.1 putative repeat protein (TIGR03806 family) [Sphingopyxis sp. JAI128]
MRRVLAALAAALLCTSGGAAGSLPGVDQAVVDSDAMPAKLSAFGLFRGNYPAQPATGLGYTLRAPLFSDSTDKHRFISIPAGKKATVAADGVIEFPVGTVLVKSFGWADVNGGRPVETRLLIHRASGWVALPYIWDADGKDATLALGGRRVPVTFKSPDGEMHSIRYAVPNKNQCKECHSLNGAIVPIGPKARNFVPDPAASATLRALYFDNPAALKPTMPQWDDPKAGTVADRARAYLDVNCAHCHNPAGSASNSGLFLRWTDDPKGVNYGIGKRPTAAGRGSGGMDFAIAPGDPAHSFLIYRLESTDPGIAMPEVGRSTVHKEGAALLRQWIAEMPKDAH